MKIFLSGALIVAAGSTASAEKAVLVCHYGSSDSETRAKTIDKITEEIREAMPGYDFRSLSGAVDDAVSLGESCVKAVVSGDISNELFSRSFLEK